MHPPARYACSAHNRPNLYHKGQPSATKIARRRKQPGEPPARGKSGFNRFLTQPRSSCGNYKPVFFEHVYEVSDPTRMLQSRLTKRIASGSAFILPVSSIRAYLSMLNANICAQRCPRSQAMRQSKWSRLIFVPGCARYNRPSPHNISSGDSPVNMTLSIA